jgi:DNA-binding NtrC family response regulator
MSGQELIQRFQLDHPETAVIYMSGWEPESAPSGMLPEGQVFLAKPFTPEALLDTVRSTLDRASATSEPGGDDKAVDGVVTASERTAALPDMSLVDG